MTDKWLEEIDIDGAEGRCEFVSAHYASDTCWRSCKTIVDVDLPALIARVRELEAREQMRVEDKKARQEAEWAETTRPLVLELDAIDQWVHRRAVKVGDNDAEIQRWHWLVTRIRALEAQAALDAAAIAAVRNVWTREQRAELRLRAGIRSDEDEEEYGAIFQEFLGAVKELVAALAALDAVGKGEE